MRIFLCGQRSFGAAALRLCLSSGHQIAGVASPAGSDKLTFEAGERGLPWMPAGTLNAQILPANVDLILAAHSHDFIGRGTRLRSRLGALGYHPSLLPRHRGRDAVAWAVKMGDAVTGGSIYWLGDTVDGGDIAAQDWCFIRPGDSASELWRRELFPMGLRLIERALKDLAAGVVVRIPQDDSLATWEPALGVAPLRRPDLIMLGPADYTVIRERYPERSRTGEDARVEVRTGAG
jgi:methionyl-tRNA formyltransferase